MEFEKNRQVEHVKKLRELAGQGKTTTEIAKILGKTNQWVTNNARRSDITVKLVSQQGTPKDKERSTKIPKAKHSSGLIVRQATPEEIEALSRIPIPKKDVWCDGR